MCLCLFLDSVSSTCIDSEDEHLVGEESTLTSCSDSSDFESPLNDEVHWMVLK